MTKADIVERVHLKIGFAKNECFDLVETVLGIMKETLESGERLMISGFGNFEVKHKADRRGRNPHTGESIILPARRVVTYKPSAILKKSINN